MLPMSKDKAKVIVNSLDELMAQAGNELGTSEYTTITQDQIQKFADATGDQQWIHTDPQRAAKESPFGTTIAHGYLTISLAPVLLAEILQANNLKMAVNYGIEKLRFMEAVKVNSRVRLSAKLAEVKNLRGTARCTFSLTFEIEGAAKAACAADVVYLYQFA